MKLYYSFIINSEQIRLIENFLYIFESLNVSKIY